MEKELVTEMEQWGVEPEGPEERSSRRQVGREFRVGSGLSGCIFLERSSRVMIETKLLDMTRNGDPRAISGEWREVTCRKVMNQSVV